MRIAYRPLFSVRLRHTFYSSGESHDDFFVEPTPQTHRMLAGHGLVTRRRSDGWTIFGEIAPGSDPAVLSRPIGDDSLRAQFFLRPKHPYVSGITDASGHRPARNLYYFDNLREDTQDGSRHLGDSVADARLGAPVELVTSTSYSYRFAAPIDGADIEVSDIFGNTFDTLSFELAEATPELRLDLGGIEGLVPGRYELNDSHGGSRSLFFAPETFGARTFAVVEIFNRTDRLTPDASERVPVGYRFLDGDEITGAGDYVIQLESRPTRWRYNVIKKYASNGITLANLDVTGDVSFDKVIESDRAVFTSDTAVALGQTPRALSLEHGGNKIRDLPSPGVATPLQAGASAGSFVSEMFIYV